MKRSKLLALSFGMDFSSNIVFISTYNFDFKMSQEMCEAEGLPQLCPYVSVNSCVCALPCLFQRCPLIEREVTAFREIREEVGVISTWILRGPSLLLLFSAAPCSDDLMALPTWGPRRSTHPQMLPPQRIPGFHRRINEVLSDR